MRTILSAKERPSPAVTAASAASTPAQRDATIDIARGVGMILVVLGHALIGAVEAADLGAPYRFAIVLIYTTHMPLFFLISGVFSESFAGKPWTQAGRTFAAAIVWPYLLWSFVLLTAHYLMSDFTNSAVETYDPLSILWRPPAVMWFLYTLGIAMILRKLLVTVPALAMAAIGAVLLIAPYVVTGAPQDVRFIGMFLLGAALARERVQAATQPALVAVALPVMAATIALAWHEAEAWARAPSFTYPAFQLAFLPAAFAGPILVVAAARALSKAAAFGRFAGALAFVGRRTMAIFVTHILITAGVRIALVRLGVDDWPMVIAIATALGVGLPLIAALIADRLKIAGLLGWRAG